MPKLFVGTALPNFLEAQFFKQPNHFTRLEYGNVSHSSTHGNCLSAHKLRLKLRNSILQKHRHHLA